MFDNASKKILPVESGSDKTDIFNPLPDQNPAPIYYDAFENDKDTLLAVESVDLTKDAFGNDIELVHTMSRLCHWIYFDTNSHDSLFQPSADSQTGKAPWRFLYGYTGEYEYGYPNFIFDLNKFKEESLEGYTGALVKYGEHTSTLADDFHVVVHKGSGSFLGEPTDWLTNYKVYFDSPDRYDKQIKAAQEFVSFIKSRPFMQGKPLLQTGHSLGGRLAAEGWGSSTDPIFTFNSISQRFAGDAPFSNVYNYAMEGDIATNLSLAKFFNGPPIKNKVWLLERDANDPWNTVSQHSITMFSQKPNRLVSKIENIYLTENPTALNIKANYLDNLLVGNQYNNKIWGLDGNDKIFADEGDDTLYGGSGNDRLYGEYGNDILEGGKGDDFINGGMGSDVYVYNYGDGNDVYDEGFVRSADILELDQAALNNLKLISLKTDPDDEIVQIRLEFANGQSITMHTRGGLDEGDHGLIKSGNKTFTLDSLRQIYPVEMNGQKPDEVNLNLSGTPNVDHLVGAQGDDMLIGLEGADILQGQAGQDALHGDGGSDQLMGGTGADLLVGGTGSDQYVYNLGDGDDTLLDSAGEANSLVFGPGIAPEDLTFFQLAEDLVINIGTGTISIQNGWVTTPEEASEGIVSLFNFADGRSFTLPELLFRDTNKAPTVVDDRFTVRDGQPVALNILANDTDQDAALNLSHIEILTQPTRGTLTNASGQLVYTGQPGYKGPDNFTYRLNDQRGGLSEAATVNLQVNLTPNKVTGTSNGDVLQGTFRPDIFIGGQGDDTLYGFEENDTLDGGLGSDTLVGGVGNDRYVIDSLQDTLLEKPGEGTDTVVSSISWTLGEHFENLTLTGTVALEGTGNAANNSLVGNALGNTLRGLDGNDRLDGKAGADVLIGGLGNDTYVVDDQDTVIEGIGEGNDTLVIEKSFTLTQPGVFENIQLAGTGGFDATGDAEDNRLTGNAGNNTLRGLAGNDVLNGKQGNDVMIGGLGDDVYHVDSSQDLVREEADAGIDRVISSISITLANHIENLTLTGMEALSGVGNELDNVLTGNKAVNLLNGGLGNDRLLGGLGNDTYLMTGLGNGYDVIQDAGGDNDVLILGDSNNALQRGQVGFHRKGQDLFVGFQNAPQDGIRIRNYFTTGTVERIQFQGDNTVLTSADITQVVSAVASYASTQGLTLSGIESVTQNPELLSLTNTYWHA